MIDYYNTFIQQEKDIHKDLMQVFKSYPKIYISDLIYLLKDEEIITENTSVPGYYTFVRPIAIDFIEDKIQMISTSHMGVIKWHPKTRPKTKRSLQKIVIYICL